MSGEFDAKCEVFSFGIVIMEVLTGILQRSNSNTDGKPVLHHRCIGKHPADNRCDDELSNESYQLLINLAKDCTKDYDSRITSMLPVVRALSEIKSKFYSPSGIEAKYKMKMDELLAQNESLVLSRDIAMVQLQQETRECIVCYDSHKLSEGYECSNKHFVCKPSGCFSNQVKTQTAYDR